MRSQAFFSLFLPTVLALGPCGGSVDGDAVAKSETNAVAVVEGDPVAAESEADVVAADDGAAMLDAPDAPAQILVSDAVDAATLSNAVIIASAAAAAQEKVRLEFDAARLREAEAKAEESLSRRRIATKTFRLSNVSAEEVAEKLNSMWPGDFGIAWKISRMAVAFPDSNALMITAPSAILEACERTIRELDVEPKQVYIEARFVELSNNASHKLGIDWQMLDGMKGSMSLDAGLNKREFDGIKEYAAKEDTYTLDNSVGKSSADLSYVNATLGMDQLYIILRALESSEDARTFSNPKIIVTSGRKATVDMTTKYPNVKISAKRTTNSGNISIDLDMQMAEIPGEDKMMFAKESFFSWGISLDVTPRIGTNGLINVQIVPTISSQSGWVEAGTSGGEAEASETISAKYPIIDVQRLVTEFNMSSETTAVIGGLSRTVETQKDNGIPFLRDLWLVGPRLFGSKVRIKEQKEIIVFVTVGFVDPKHISKDAGLPKNAVLGRQYTDDFRHEPGDRARIRDEGVRSLDIRPLEEQYANPRSTEKAATVGERLTSPFVYEKERTK